MFWYFWWPGMTLNMTAYYFIYTGDSELSIVMNLVAVLLLATGMMLGLRKEK